MKPVSRTAFYCCGVRMQDAASPNPVCGDTLAARFIDDGGKNFLKDFQGFSRQNASTVARHRMIDDLLRAALRDAPNTRIIIIGAGFDTRPHRLSGGRWVELDEPEVFALKEACLPVSSSPNDLVRIPIEFAKQSLAEKLAPYAGKEPCIIVLEGVSMYLTEQALQSTARAIREALPNASLVADFMSTAFCERYSKKLFNRFQQFGATFHAAKRHPVEVFLAEGFRVLEQQSIVGRAIEAGTFRMPRWIFRYMFRTLREGYSVWVLGVGPHFFKADKSGVLFALARPD